MDVVWGGVLFLFLEFNVCLDWGKYFGVVRRIICAIGNFSCLFFLIFL